VSPNCGRFVMVNAYSHELSSCGFWSGGGPIDEQAFYAYAYPEPKGFKDFYPPRMGILSERDEGIYITRRFGSYCKIP